MKEILEVMYNTIWSLPFILALLSVGLYFSFKLKFVQIRHLGEAFKYLLNPQKERTLGDVSNFGSLCTALSATLGTGNIVGIAVAVSIGGPGTLFWLTLSSFFSLATKYCEGFLSIKYRQVGSDGKIAGGPMYYIEKGLNNELLAKLFAFFGACVALVGIGTLAQTNSIAVAATSLGISKYVTAGVLGIIVAFVIFGGIHRIAEIAKKVVPVMTICYLGIAITILILRFDMILPALNTIVTDAFSPQAIVGGGFGTALIHSIQTGISRGIFCHEAGLGSAAIASAAAKVNNAREQGLISMVGAFMSIIICVITGLVLMVTLNGASTCTVPVTSLTAYAFGSGLGILSLGYYVVNISIVFFAFTTIIGWNYYGEKCAQYLISTKAIKYYRLLYILFVIAGPFLNIEAAFVIADIAIGLMAIPNIISLIMLRKEIKV